MLDQNYQRLLYARRQPSEEAESFWNDRLTS